MLDQELITENYKRLVEKGHPHAAHVSDGVQKTCGNCRQSLPIAYFGHTPHTFDGLEPFCKPCTGVHGDV